MAKKARRRRAWTAGEIRKLKASAKKKTAATENRQKTEQD